MVKYSRLRRFSSLRYCAKCLDDTIGVDNSNDDYLTEYICKNLGHFCSNNKSKGIILEVDLEYPEELHNLHNDYPLAAEKLKVNNDMLSPYAVILKN